MTQEQFDALATLISARAGDSRDAAQLVLVGGMKPADAARQTGLTAAGVGNALRRFRQALDLARQAAGTALK